MFRSRIPKITAEMAPILDEALQSAAETVAENARQRVPVDTGDLRDAIHVERTGFGEFAVIAGNDNAFYGHIVEHGGTRTPAHPFLVPALEETAPAAVAKLAAALRAL